MYFCSIYCFCKSNVIQPVAARFLIINYLSIYLDSTCPLPLLPPSPFAAVVSLMPRQVNGLRQLKKALPFEIYLHIIKFSRVVFFLPWCRWVRICVWGCPWRPIASESHERPKVSLSYPVLRFFAQVFDEYFQLFVKGFLCPPTDLFPVSAYNRGAIFWEWDLCSLCNRTICIQFKLNQMYYAFFPVEPFELVWPFKLLQPNKIDCAICAV